MSNEEKVDIYDGNNPDNVQRPGRESRLIFEIPGPDKPLVCKCLFDPRGKQSFIPIAYFPHLLGPNPETDTRYHPSRKSLDLGDSPENDRYWELAHELKRLREAGRKESAEYQRLSELKKTFNSKDKGWLFIVEPNSATIRAVKIGAAIINRLFGKEKTYHRPEVKSIIKEMKTKGLSPYDMRNNEGWIKIYKTGAKLATEYFVELVDHEIQVEHGGKTIPTRVPTELQVHEKIQASDLVLSDFPDPVKFECESVWTLEESQAFVESEGKEIPERCFKKKGDGGGSQEAGAASEENPFGDTIPEGEAAQEDLN
jgi:hypothetical protein